MRVVLAGLPWLEHGLEFALTELEPDPEAIAREFWRAQPQQPPFPDPIVIDSTNAAARYILLARRVPGSLGLAAGWVETDFLALRLLDESQAGMTPAELTTALEEAQPWVRAVMDASTMERCTLGNVQHPGFNSQFPADDPRQGYFGQCRRMFRVLRADAIRCASAGDHDGSVERLISAIKMSRQIAWSDNSMIGALVADGALNQAMEAIRRLVQDHGPALSSTQLTRLRAVVAALDPEDPAGLHARWCDQSARYAEFIDDQTADGRVGLALQMRLGEMLGVRAMYNSMSRSVTAAFKPVEDGEVQRPARPIEQGFLPDAEDVQETVEEAIPLMRAPTIRSKLTDARAAAHALEQAWASPDGEAAAAEAQKVEESDATGVANLVLTTPKIVHRTWRKTVGTRELTLAAINEQIKSVEPAR